ncbi:MAG TPA: hypothetical protein PLI09_08260 [Candidatus Hydrogenedentes bacterium]|nr:hypothetical protein [Candidatus Hydrogenedentota bacterium]
MGQTLFDSRRLGLNDFFKHTFSDPGVVRYGSTLAPALDGIIKVKANEGDPPEFYTVIVSIIDEDPPTYLASPQRYVLLAGDSVIWSFPGYMEQAAYDIVAKEEGLPLDSRILKADDMYGIASLDVGKYLYKAYREEPTGGPGGEPAFTLVTQGEIEILEDYPEPAECQDCLAPIEVELPPDTPNPPPVQGSIMTPVQWVIKNGAWYITCEKVS